MATINETIQKALEASLQAVESSKTDINSESSTKADNTDSTALTQEEILGQIKHLEWKRNKIESWQGMNGIGSLNAEIPLPQEYVSQGSEEIHFKIPLLVFIEKHLPDSKSYKDQYSAFRTAIIESLKNANTIKDIIDEAASNEQKIIDNIDKNDFEKHFSKLKDFVRGILEAPALDPSELIQATTDSFTKLKSLLESIDGSSGEQNSEAAASPDGNGQDGAENEELKDLSGMLSKLEKVLLDHKQAAIQQFMAFKKVPQNEQLNAMTTANHSQYKTVFAKILTAAQENEQNEVLPTKEPLFKELDDIEEIGDKRKKDLNDAGIETLEQLTDKTAAELQKITKAGHAKVRLWQVQADLALKGQNRDLTAFQDKINGGRLSLANIEGIGDTIEKALEDKIDSIFELAEMSEAELRKIVSELKNTDGRKIGVNPDSWKKQAQLLASGQMTKLQKYQDELKGGIAPVNDFERLDQIKNVVQDLENQQASVKEKLDFLKSYTNALGKTQIAGKAFLEAANQLQNALKDTITKLEDEKKVFADKGSVFFLKGFSKSILDIGHKEVKEKTTTEAGATEEETTPADPTEETIDPFAEVAKAMEPLITNSIHAERVLSTLELDLQDLNITTLNVIQTFSKHFLAELENLISENKKDEELNALQSLTEEINSELAEAQTQQKKVQKLVDFENLISGKGKEDA